MVELQAILQTLNDPASGSAVLATLVTVEGSSYRRPGARMLLTASGKRAGAISGGCLEEDLLGRARHVFASGGCELVRYDTTSENDLVWGVGLGCHGIVQVLLEPLPARPNWAAALESNIRQRSDTQLAVVWKSGSGSALGTYLAGELPPDMSDQAVFWNTIKAPVQLYVFGAGDDAMPLVRLAKELGWRVTVADPRSSFVTKERFPHADALVVGPAQDLVGKTDPSKESVSVVMTHHYVHDVPLLRSLLIRPSRYVGLLGPKKRALQIVGDLRQAGTPLTDEALARLHAPVGLDLGAETPEEVALSVIAEIQAVLAGRDGGPLRNRVQPIHHPLAPID